MMVGRADGRYNSLSLSSIYVNSSVTQSDTLSIRRSFNVRIGQIVVVQDNERKNFSNSLYLRILATNVYSRKTPDLQQKLYSVHRASLDNVASGRDFCNGATQNMDARNNVLQTAL